MTPTRPTRPFFGLWPALPRSARRANRALALLLVSGPLLLATAAARADDDESYRNYFEFQAGVAHIPNQTIDGGVAGMGSVQPDEAGYHFGGALGRHIGDLFRAEIAVSYRQADLDQAGFTSGTQADGDVSLFAAMLNGYVDFDLGWIVPWAGAGVGVGSYKIDVYQQVAGAFDIDDGDPVFVYNTMVGATLPLNDSVAFNFGYRYVAIAGEQGSSALIAPATTSQQVDDEFDAHEAVLGLRFNF